MKMISGILLLTLAVACSKAPDRTTTDTAPTIHDTAMGGMAMPGMTDTAGKAGMGGMIYAASSDCRVVVVFHKPA